MIINFNRDSINKWSGLIFYLLVLSFLSLNPWLLPDSKQAVGAITWDLIDHFAAYGLFSILIMSVLKTKNLKTTLFTILISSLTGILFEFGQHYLTSNRQFSLLDAVANIAGALLGVAIFWCIQFFYKRISQ